RAEAAPLRRPPDRDQLERASPARARRTLAALFLSAKSDRLYRGQAALSLIAMKPKAPRKTTRPPKPAAAKIKPSLQLVALLVQALDAKKAEGLQVLDIGKVSSITDYMVLATGTSEPHLRALRIEVERVFDEQKARIVGVD